MPSLEPIIAPNVAPLTTSLTILCDSTLDLYSPVQLNAAFAPIEAAPDVLWSVSDEAYASVSADGILTPKKKGKVVLVCAAQDGSAVSASLELTILIKSGDLLLSGPATLRAGASASVKLGYYPAGSPARKVSYISSNEKAATVSSRGKVTARSVSKATPVTITVKAMDGSGLTASCDILIQPKAKSVSIYHQGAKVSSLSLDMTGGTRTIPLSAVVSPADANPHVTWSSSNAKLATVDANGTVTLLKPGRVTITATAKDGSGKRARVTLTLSYQAESITVSGGGASLRAGKAMTLRAVVSPSNVSNDSVTWTSSDSKAAAVSSRGRVSAKNVSSLRQVTIRATAKDGSKVYGEYTLTVYPKASSLSVHNTAGSSVSSISLDAAAIGVPFALSASVLPATADQGVLWSSSSKKVATVDQNGLVTPLASGKTTLTAKAADGSGKYKRVTLTVTRQVRSIALSGASTLAGGQRMTLKAAISPSDADSKKVYYTTHDTKYISVSKTSGRITAKRVSAPVVVSVRATAQDGSGITADYSFTVYPAVSKLSVTRNGTSVTKLYLDPSDPARAQAALTAAISPAAAQNAVTWSSSNKKVATVDASGIVTAHRSGRATITATALDGSRRKDSVTVYSAQLIQSLSLGGDITLVEGKTARLAPDILPGGADNKRLSYTTSDKKAATVSSRGVITAKSTNTVRQAVITAKANDGSGVSAQLVVTVVPKVNALSILSGGADVSGQILYYNMADIPVFTSKTTPSGGESAVVWQISDSAVATVTAAGIVHPLAAGSAVLSARTADGRSASVTLSFSQSAQSVTIAGESRLASGQSTRLTAAVLPAGAAESGVTWAFDTEGGLDFSAFASLSEDGLLTALHIEARTDVVIRATAKDGSGVFGLLTVALYPTAADMPGADSTYRALIVVEPTDTAYGLLKRQTDLDGMEKVLKMQNFNGKTFQSVNTMHQTSAAAVLSAISSLASGSKDADITYFYFLGHGDEQGRLIFYDNSVISPSALKSALDKVKGRVVVLLANCYSGYYVAQSTGANALLRSRSEAETTSAPPSAFCSKIIGVFAGESRNRSAVAANSGELREGKYCVLTASLYNESSWFNYYLVNGAISESRSFDRFTRGLYRAGGWDQLTSSTLWSGKSVTLHEVYQQVRSYVNSFTDLQSSVQVYPSGSDFVIFQH